MPTGRAIRSMTSSTCEELPIEGILDAVSYKAHTENIDRVVAVPWIHLMNDALH